jgi:hypothetical protein
MGTVRGQPLESAHRDQQEEEGATDEVSIGTYLGR